MHPVALEDPASYVLEFNMSLALYGSGHESLEQHRHELFERRLSIDPDPRGRQAKLVILVRESLQAGWDGAVESR